MKRFLLIVLALSIPTLAYASSRDRCSAKPVYDNHGRYVGCLTVVNGHQHMSTATGLTELGCKTYCSALTGRPTGLDSDNDSDMDIDSDMDMDNDVAGILRGAK
jgi:hypothetical protein